MDGFTLPTDRRISQPFGAEFDDWDGDGDVDYPGGFYHSIGWDGHNGIDYACGLGDPVKAVADGVVVWAAWAGNHWLLSGGGNAVLIQHPAHAVQTEYLHLSWIVAKPGQRITRGQVIGYAGKTGAATGYHLHLGMLPLRGININNRYRGRIDPTPYLYGGMAAAGTITPQASTPPPEEDDMYTDQDRERDSRQTQILEAMETDTIRALIKELSVNDYVKGDADDSIYELKGGTLRGISGEEWELLGRPDPAIFPQAKIDNFPKVD